MFELALVVVLLLTVVGFLVVIDRKDERAKKDREEHRKEVQTLLNRIEYPGTYVPTETPPASTTPHHLPYEDDEAWQKYLGVNS